MDGISVQQMNRNQKVGPGSRLLRWAGLILLVCGTLILNWFSAVIGHPAGQSVDPFSVSVPVLFLLSGLAIMVRRPWHQVGWAMLTIGFGWTLTSSPANVLGIAPHWFPWLAWAYDGIGGYISYTAMVWLLMVFPDGLSERDRRGRMAGRATIALMVLMTLASFASHPVHGGATSVLGAYPNPFGLNWVPRAVADTGVVVIFGGVVASIASLWVRHRRSSGETRRRYMVVLYAFWLLGFGVAFGLALSDAIGGVAWWPAMVGWILLPASFVVALVRHGLYGVDKVVSRTVTYGLLAVAVTVVYTIPVLLAPRLIGGSNQVIVAAATLAAAAVFNPLRRRIQATVDRRFNRSRYDARREVEAFVAALPAEVDLEGVTDEFLGVASRIVQPTRAGLWIREVR